jgi:predicted metalloprotease
MQWRNRKQSDHIEDNRGQGSSMGGVGLKGGIGTAVLALVLWGVFGLDPRTALQVSQQVQSGLPASTARQAVPETAESQRDRAFVGVVLADTEAVWQQVFAEQGQSYQAPTLVLFQQQVRSACGAAESAMGPFYCPADQKVYLDMGFFADMRKQLGVTGEQSGSGDAAADSAGDFAQAYVIAHEVGHHVQHLLGTSDQVDAARRANPAQANALSVRLELQADCFAGIWANRNQQRVQFLQQGDLEEALDAATQIGDDRLQQRGQGYVVPESFTHGSSAQRVKWFKAGVEQGTLAACDTFNHPI